MKGKKNKEKEGISVHVERTLGETGHPAKGGAVAEAKTDRQGTPGPSKLL